MPSVIYTTFKELGFDNFTICINNRKILNGLFESLNISDNKIDVMRIIDKIEKIGKNEVEKELKEINLSDESILKIIDFISIDGDTDEKINKLEKLNLNNEVFNEGLTELKDVIKYIRLFGVEDTYFEIDLKIARGLDYYTGTVYETFLNDYRKLGSVCSGGRYDNLAEFYTDKKLPGVGISIGFTRLFYQLNEAGAIKTNKQSISDVLVVPMDEEIEDALQVATELRNAGINTDVYLENSKIKKKMKYADKWNIPYVIIIGEEERNTKKYALKNMETGEQESLSIQDIIKHIK